MKFDKKKLLGPFFRPLSNAKHSRASRILVATAWLPSQLLRARHNYPYFAVDIVSKKGMGAVLVESLLMCNYAEINALIPKISSSNSLYASEKGKDFINRYLGPETEGVANGLRPMRFHTLWNFYHLTFEQHLTLEVASRLFWKYFSPKPVIRDKVEAILAKQLGGKFDLSVHYRGTDKVLEAPLVAFSIFEKAIRAHEAAGGSIRSLFLATDDVDFEHFVRQQFPETSFTTFNLGSPGDATHGRHFSDISPDDKATESLVNIFLLAAAPVCIRVASYMSAMSKIVNPDLVTVSLNRTHWGSTGFPEFQIVAEEHDNVLCG